jgi:5,10-methylenetetrahydromethanopterin reductase
VPASTPEIWISLFPQPARVAGYAEMVERDRWDGLAVTDSQNNNGDAFCALTIAALATKRIKLTTAATNPYTRRPATVASAAATVHAVSGGRAVLGIGRGDSSVRTLGQEPVSLSYFRQALVQIQTYLGGGSVNIDGTESRMPWVQNLGLPKLPMSVSATGPKVIEIGAQVAERVTFSLGAEMSRLRWAVDLARASREKAGLDPAGLSLGSYVVAVVEPDIAKARDIARSRMGIYAHHWTMHPNASATLEAADRAKAETRTLDDDFVDRYGVVGSASYVVERLQEILALGLDHLIVVGYGASVPAEMLAEASRRFGSDVIPSLKR